MISLSIKRKVNFLSVGNMMITKITTERQKTTSQIAHDDFGVLEFTNCTPLNEGTDLLLIPITDGSAIIAASSEIDSKGNKSYTVANPREQPKTLAITLIKISYKQITY